MPRKQNNSIVIFVLSCLVLLNLYQVYKSSQKENEIEKLLIEQKNLEVEFVAQSNALKRLVFAELLLINSNVVKLSYPLKHNLTLISIFPESSCGSCIAFDSKFLAGINEKHPERVHIYAISENPSFPKENYLPNQIDYTLIDDINEIIDIENDLDYILNAPIHLLINRYHEIISVHVTEFYFPNKSELFFQKILSTF